LITHPFPFDIINKTNGQVKQQTVRKY